MQTVFKAVELSLGTSRCWGEIGKSNLWQALWDAQQAPAPDG